MLPVAAQRKILRSMVGNFSQSFVAGEWEVPLCRVHASIVYTLTHMRMGKLGKNR
jgi:hypothetical protein